MDASILESILEELKNLNENVAGMRADMKEAREKGMADSMAQVLASLKGTPLEGIMANMTSKMKAGGFNG